MAERGRTGPGAGLRAGRSDRGSIRTFLLVIPAIVAAALTGPACRGNRAEPMRGDLLSLTEGLKSEYIVETPLERPEPKPLLEKLDLGWTCLSKLKNGVMLFQTRSRRPIESNFGRPVLTLGSTELTAQDDLFPEATPAGRWTWDGSGVMITTGKDPSGMDYRLKYYPGVEFKPRLRRTHLVRKQRVAVLPGIRIFALDHPLDPGKQGAKPRRVDVFKNNAPLPFEPRLIDALQGPGLSMNAPRAQSQATQYPRGWAYLPGADFWLFKAEGAADMILPRTGRSHKQKRFFRAGPAKFVVRARANPGGPNYPALEISLDGQKIGEIIINDVTQRDYELECFIAQGWHEVRFTLKNGSIAGPPRASGSNRQIFLRQIRLHYPEALVLGDRAARAEYSLTDFSAESPGVRWVQPFVFSAELSHEARTALFAAPKTVISYPLVIPPEAFLTFGLGMLPAAKNKPTAPAKFAVRLKPGSGAERTLFETTCPADKKRDWQDFRVDLGSYANQRALLTLETTTGRGGPEPGLRLAVSQPLIISRRPKPGGPNIFIIVADALRADHLGCYGYPRPTSPRLDELALDGVLFEQAVSAAPWTLASIASLFTSLPPSFHGANFMDGRLDTSLNTLPQELKRHGYLAASFVQSDLLGQARGFAPGFDWCRNDLSGGDTAARLLTALRRLDQIAGARMFLFFHVLEPHSPYAPSAASLAALGVSKMPDIDASSERLQQISWNLLPLSRDEMRQYIALYDGEVRDFDEVLGRFLAGLKSRGLYDEAMIIVASDHGEEFKDHDRMLHTQSLFQEVLHVPLVIKFPARMKLGGRRVSSPVGLMDIMPTVLDAAGIRPASALQGMSLLPFLAGTRSPGLEERVIVSELMDHNLALRQGRYSYILDRKTGVEMLFDLENDPAERIDLARKRPDLLASFQKENGKFETARGIFAKGKKQSDRVTLDAKEIERLRALGYIK